MTDWLSCNIFFEQPIVDGKIYYQLQVNTIYIRHDTLVVMPYFYGFVCIFLNIYEIFETNKQNVI